MREMLLCGDYLGLIAQDVIRTIILVLSDSETVAITAIAVPNLRANLSIPTLYASQPTTIYKGMS